MLKIEQAWTLVALPDAGACRVRRVRERRGEPARVTADGKWTLRREETRGDVIGFYHTHPDGPLRPSRRDLRTMRAWCDALGKPLVCVIATPDEVGAWWFDAFDADPRRATIVRVMKTQLLIQKEAGDDAAE